MDGLKEAIERITRLHDERDRLLSEAKSCVDDDGGFEKLLAQSDDVAAARDADLARLKAELGRLHGAGELRRAAAALNKARWGRELATECRERALEIEKTDRLNLTRQAARAWNSGNPCELRHFACKLLQSARALRSPEMDDGAVAEYFSLVGQAASWFERAEAIEREYGGYGPAPLDLVGLAESMFDAFGVVGLERFEKQINLPEEI